MYAFISTSCRCCEVSRKPRSDGHNFQRHTSHGRRTWRRPAHPGPYTQQQQKKTQPHTACNIHSSILTSGARASIRACIHPVVANARKRLHSPQAPTHAPDIQVRRPRHHSLAADCSVDDASDDSKRALVRAFVRKAGLTRHSVRVRFAGWGRCNLRFSVHGRTTLAWIGPVLVAATRHKWQILDVVEPCRMIVDHHDSATLTRHRSVFAFNTAQTNASPVTPQPKMFSKQQTLHNMHLQFAIRNSCCSPTSNRRPLPRPSRIFLGRRP
jgi:hypothetical protein